MKAIDPHNPHWAQRAGSAILAPFRFVMDVIFCGFVVVAAFTMLLFCTLLATFGHFIYEPWKMHHPAR